MRQDSPVINETLKIEGQPCINIDTFISSTI